MAQDLQAWRQAMGLDRFDTPPEAAKAVSSPVKDPVATRVPPQPVAPVKTEATQPQEGEGFSGTEMLGNLPSSFIKNAKAILWDLPKEALGAVKRYALDPSQYLADLKLVPQYLPDIKDAIKDDYADYYGNFGRRVSEDPFRFLSDVAGVAAIGGGTAATVSTKAAQAARIAAPAAAKAAIAVGKGARAIKGLTYLDPVDATFGAFGKIAPRMLEGFGYGKYTPDIKAGEATIDAEGEVIAQSLGTKLWFGKLSEQDRVTLTESFVDADKDFLANLKATRPDIWEARQKIQDEFLTPDSKYWTEDEKVVKSGDAHDALVKGLVRWRKQTGKWKDVPEPEAYQMAHDLIKSGQNTPVYMKIFNDKSAGKDFFDVINDKIYNTGILSRGEHRMLTGQVPTDSNQILAHQIRASLGAKKAIKFARFIMGLMSSKNELKVVTKSMGREQIDALRKAGYAPFHGPFWEKYFETFGKAVNHIAEQVKVKGSTIANIVDAAEDMKSMSLKAEEMMTNPIQEVWVPKHVAAYAYQKLNPEWANSFMGKGIRAALNMGGLLPYYKAIATVFNPRYYIANAVGNAALAFLYGLHPQALKYAHTLKDLVPDEIKDIGLSPMFRHEAGLFMGTANRFAQFAQKIDLFFKRGIYMNDAIVNGIKEGILKTGKDFFVAENVLREHLARLRHAPNDYVDNLVELTKSKEKLAFYAKNLQAAKGELGSTSVDLAKASARDGKKVKSAGMADPVYDAPKPYRAPEDVTYSDSPAGPAVVPDSPKLEATNTDPIYGADLKVSEPVSIGFKAKADKAIEKIEIEIIELRRALAKYSANSTVESLIDLLGKVNKQESDFLEALAYNPLATDKYIRKLIDNRLSRIEKIKSLPRYKEGVTGPSVGDDIYGGGRVEKPVGGQYDFKAPVGPKLQGYVSEPKPKPEATQYEDAPGYKPVTLSQAKVRDLSIQSTNKQEVISQLEANMMDAIVQRNQLARLSPVLAREAQMTDRAIQTSNKFLGSYARLSPFERKVLRQFIPFYTFTKAMTQLAFRLPFRMPARQFVYLNLWRLWNDIADEDSPRSSWFRNMTAVAALADGSILMIRDGSFNPFANVRMSGSSGIEIPGAWDILGSHPIFRLVINGRGQLSPKPVSPGEKATRLDNGEVWEFTGSGFKRVVAQPSWKKALWQLFPQTQMIDSVFLNAVQSDKGFTLAQDPILGPNGKPVFPLGWQERMLGMAIPATRVNLDQLKRREMGKYQQVVRSYLEDIRRAPPAKRETIRQVLHQLREDIGRKYLEY